MNRKRIILVGLALLQMINIFSQRIEFQYDDNGNRVNRVLVVEQLQEKTVNFPIDDPKTLKSVEYSKGSFETTENESSDRLREENMKSEDQKIDIVVYPNPGKGIVKIDISNMPLNSESDLRLYDLSGLEILSKRNIENYTEIDITKYKDGVYILRIKINGILYDWKVIKHN